MSLNEIRLFIKNQNKLQNRKRHNSLKIACASCISFYEKKKKFDDAQTQRALMVQNSSVLHTNSFVWSTIDGLKLQTIFREKEIQCWFEKGQFMFPIMKYSVIIWEFFYNKISNLFAENANEKYFDRKFQTFNINNRFTIPFQLVP